MVHLQPPGRGERSPVDRRQKKLSDEQTGKLKDSELHRVTGGGEERQTQRKGLINNQQSGTARQLMMPDAVDKLGLICDYWSLNLLVFCALCRRRSVSIMSPNPSKGYDRCFCIRMKSTLTKRGVHFKSSGYRVRTFACTLSF